MNISLHITFSFKLTGFDSRKKLDITIGMIRMGPKILLLM